MKTIPARSVFFILGFFLLTLSACNPKDIKVTDDATRDRIINRQFSGSSFKLTGPTVVVTLAEKQTEAVSYLKMVLDPSYSKKRNWNRLELSDNTIQITSSLLTTETPSVRGPAQQTLQKQLLGKVQSGSKAGDDNKQSLKVEVVNDGLLAHLITVAPQQGKASEITWTEKSYRLEAEVIDSTGPADFVNENQTQKSDNSDETQENPWKVKVTIQGMVKATRDNQVTEEEFQITGEFKLKSTDLKLSQVEGSDSSWKMQFLKSNGKHLSYILKSSQFKIETTPDCEQVSMIFDGNFNGKSFSQFQLNQDQWSVQLGKQKLPIPVQVCSQRNIFDLSRLWLTRL